MFVSVLPVGFLQLEAAFTQSYAFSRSLTSGVVKKRSVVRSVDSDSTGESTPVSERVLSGDD